MKMRIRSSLCFCIVCPKVKLPANAKTVKGFTVGCKSFPLLRMV